MINVRESVIVNRKSGLIHLKYTKYQNATVKSSLCLLLSTTYGIIYKDILLALSHYNYNINYLLNSFNNIC
jgi:hypothetical protein